MNKTELISAVAAEAALTKKEAKKAIDAFIQTVENAIETGDKVALMGFGTFGIVEKKSRKGVDPQTKKPITIPAHKTVKFKPGSEWTKSVK
jgi:DNA-binding protein HU-beta